MPNIYQQIWDADQTGAGVRAIFSDQNDAAGRGFVKVNHDISRPAAGPDFRLLTEVVIPPEQVPQTFTSLLPVISRMTSTASSRAPTYSSRPKWLSLGVGLRQLTVNVCRSPWSASCVMLFSGSRSKM